MAVYDKRKFDLNFFLGLMLAIEKINEKYEKRIMGNFQKETGMF